MGLKFYEYQFDKVLKEIFKNNNIIHIHNPCALQGSDESPGQLLLHYMWSKSMTYLYRKHSAAP